MVTSRPAASRTTPFPFAIAQHYCIRSPHGVDRHPQRIAKRARRDRVRLAAGGTCRLAAALAEALLESWRGASSSRATFTGLAGFPFATLSLQSGSIRQDLTSVKEDTRSRGAGHRC